MHANLQTLQSYKGVQQGGILAWQLRYGCSVEPSQVSVKADIACVIHSSLRRADLSSEAMCSMRSAAEHKALRLMEQMMVLAATGEFLSFCVLIMARVSWLMKELCFKHPSYAKLAEAAACQQVLAPSGGGS